MEERQQPWRDTASQRDTPTALEVRPALLKKALQRYWRTLNAIGELPDALQHYWRTLNAIGERPAALQRTLRRSTPLENDQQPLQRA